MGRGESRLKPILLLEDDAALLDGLCYALKKDGFEVTCARTAAQALCLLKEGEYGLLLLDVSLPDGTGFEVCEWVRGRGDGVPILFLTAADEEVSVMRGLDCGGDDYVTKPFRFGELCARIRALLRRAGDGYAAGDRLVCGDVSVNLASCRAAVRGRPLELTAAEYRLLCLLLREAGRVVSRQAILSALWDSGGDFVDDNTLSVYVRRLREKLEEDPSHPRRLLTERGLGYRFKAVDA